MRRWLVGLIGAAINVAANSITLMVVDPLKFNLFDGGAAELGKVAVVSAIIGAALYVKTHPLESAIDCDDPQAK